MNPAGYGPGSDQAPCLCNTTCCKGCIQVPGLQFQKHERQESTISPIDR